jgi:hypothetical protein
MAAIQEAGIVSSVARILRRSLIVAFNFKCRWISELFGVMFQDYLAYTASACADHETVPCRFDHRIGDQVKVVDTENSLDLG